MSTTSVDRAACRAADHDAAGLAYEPCQEE